MDESNAADNEYDSEEDDESDPAPPKKQRLQIPLKKKPGEKLAAKGIKIQDPKDKPSARPPLTYQTWWLRSPWPPSHRLMLSTLRGDRSRGMTLPNNNLQRLM